MLSSRASARLEGAGLAASGAPWRRSGEINMQEDLFGVVPAVVALPGSSASPLEILIIPSLAQVPAAKMIIAQHEIVFQHRL